MRLRCLPLLVLTASLLACGGHSSRDRASAAPAAAPIAGQPVTVTLESPGMGQLPAALFGGALYYAGQDGQQYAIRIGNNTAARVEVVVTVDGRDVVSGALGDYRKQRGYIIEPFGQIVVDGFRQSLDQVAAFRFSGLADSYTALQGTPQHAGVIGIAVFEEREGRKKKTGPLAVGPTPADASPFPENAGPRDAGRREAPRASSPEPFAGADASQKSAESAPLADEAAAPTTSASPGSGGSFAPPPVPRNELGTQYGESQSSSVHEVEFKRKRKRKPDAVLAIYYDSARGLAARGIPVGGSIGFEAEPFPQRFPTR
jgi:hypothetical protein